jgi:hypothetical protein
VDERTRLVVQFKRTCQLLFESLWLRIKPFSIQLWFSSLCVCLRHYIVHISACFQPFPETR